MTRDKVIDALLIAGIALPLLSIFMWAGFDIRWWAQTRDGIDAREFALLIIHVAVPSFCAMFLDLRKRTGK